MFCLTSCFFGVLLLSVMIISILNSKFSNTFHIFRKDLSNNQYNIYKKIHKERFTIFIQGMILGLIISLIIIKNFLDKNTKLSKTCFFLFITLLVNMTYYQITPKSDYMLKHLNGEKQIQLWINMYNEMKYIKLLGIFIGSIGYGIIGYNTF